MNALIQNVSTHLQSAQFAALFLDALLKSFVVLALAGAVCALWRRASAATRHLIWVLALAALPFLPLLNSTRPAWQKPVWTISATAGSGNLISLALELSSKIVAPAESNPADDSKISAATGANSSGRKVAAQFNPNWLVLGWLAWLAGSSVVLIRMATAHFQRHRLARAAQPLQGADWTRLLNGACETLHLQRTVHLLQSASEVMPMTWGWLRPVVLLPAEAAQWPEERRRVVLLHELAHVKRQDYLTQIAAQLVGALYWFNPLVWLAARRMCVEREGACDDLVLAGGCRASDYAGHLVEIAARFQRVPQMAAIAMARSSHLEGRIAAIVDASRNRRLRSAAAVAILGLIAGIAICLGGSAANTAGGPDNSDPLRQQQIERLKAFSVEKEKQSETLAAATGETISPEFRRFFDAAISGDLQTVTNLFESFKQHHPQYNHPHQHSDVSLRTSFWGPVLEICLGYDAVALCEPAYTQMAVDDIINSIPAGSIYFGGTDPGRGLPSAFSKSHVDADPFYTLTQNALADGTYLDYLQRTYGDQRKLLGQLAEACRADVALQTLSTNYYTAGQKLEALEINENDPQWKAADETVRTLWEQRDDAVKAILATVQEHANTGKATGQNPGGPATLYIPTAEDSQRCFQDYIQDARKRLENHQLKPDEDVKVDPDSGRVNVSGQVAVMEINGLLAKIIFDKNPGHEFFIEESWPLDWMYPYLEPHGLIMKVNRQPLPEISDAMIQQDRDFWQPRVTQMIGGWLNDKTPVKKVTAFGGKVFQQHDLGGFSGDPRYVQNDYAARTFSKLRASIAGLYAWRAENGSTADEKKRMAGAADFAFRQAIALCPYSPEATHRYANFLNQQHREADAKLVQAMAEEFKPMPANASASSKASVFQIRLALDVPTDNTEPMRLESRPGSTAKAASPTDPVNVGGKILVGASLTNFNGSAPINWARLNPDGSLNTNFNPTPPPTTQESLYVARQVLLDQTAVQSATLGKSPQGYAEIEISLTDAGGKQFAEITRQHLHQRLAMVIDGKLRMAPVVQTPITEGKAIITGSFSDEEAKDLIAEINEAAGK